MDKKSDRQKFPESAWKCFVYSLQWGYLCNLLVFSGKYDYFTESTKIWDDWVLGMEVPWDITLIYYIECGFYLHSIYGTLFMDEKRKDFIVMLVHHVLTIVLIVVSYGTR